MNHKTRASFVVLSVVLAGCGSGSDGAASGDSETYVSPISEFLGVESIDWESPEGQAKIIDDQRKANELIVVCMAEQGFEYIPDNPDQMISFESTDSEGLEWGSQEWAAKYGFGVTTQRWQQSVVGPELVGMADDQYQGQEYVDPNAEYMESLSEAEQMAFQEALWGNDPGYEWDESLTDEENEDAMNEFYSDYVPTGCQNTAYNDQNKEQAFYTEFGDEMQSMWESVESDPRLEAKQADVKACVEDKGLVYIDENEIWQEWEDEMNEIEAFVTYPGMDLTEDDYNTMSEQELNAIYNEPATMTDEGKALLAELQAKEIPLAVASIECGGGWENLSDLYTEIQAEYEQKFLDDNADAIADFAGSGATAGE